MGGRLDATGERLGNGEIRARRRFSSKSSDRGHLVAALLLPLYYLADATITLLRRLATGQPVMQAHRTHFYQRAMDGGFSVYQIVGRVFLVNVIILGLAAATLLAPSFTLHLVALALGCVLVGALLCIFNRI